MALLNHLEDWMRSQCVKHDLAPDVDDYVNKQINAMTNYEIIKEISDYLEARLPAPIPAVLETRRDEDVLSSPVIQPGQSFYAHGRELESGVVSWFVCSHGDKAQVSLACCPSEEAANVVISALNVAQKLAAGKATAEELITAVNKDSVHGFLVVGRDGRYRAFKPGVGYTWTKDQSEALWLARESDARAISEDDEDAYNIVYAMCSQDPAK